MIRTRRLPRFAVRFRSKKKIYLFRFILILLVILIVFLVFNARLRPVIRDYAYARAVYLATRTINEAVNEEISKSDIKYNDLVYLEKNDAGNITALQTNIIKINTLKSSVTSYVIDKLNSLNTSELNIPLGTISGVDFLVGVGPRIHISIVPLGQATATFGSEFTSAGINQTRHKITLEVSATVTIVLPTDSIQTQVTTHVDIAETVIVGEVPSYYTNIGDTVGESIDKITGSD